MSIPGATRVRVLIFRSYSPSCLYRGESWLCLCHRYSPLELVMPSGAFPNLVKITGQEVRTLGPGSVRVLVLSLGAFG